MIRLKLSFEKDQTERTFDIEKGELLNKAIERAVADVPKGKFEVHETFNITVNGLLIEKDFWEKVSLKVEDEVIISPKIKGGDAGQLFKQALLIVIVAVATVYFPPAAGLANALIVAGITIGASLALNALIPPPVPELGGSLGGLGEIDSSQMYSISGQSNAAKRLGIVPKVYGKHRIFPPLACTPYTELATSPGVYAHKIVGSLSYQAKKVGPNGNKIVIKYQNGGTVGNETVSVSGNTVTITYVQGVSTANQILAKIVASSAAKALIGAEPIDDGTSAQTFIGQTNLVGGEEAGETVQYLYAIYDFGLGTPQISELKIGDTPLTTDSFEDFDYNFVDPNKNTVDADEFDEFLDPEFKLYAKTRSTTQLSIAFNDGDENIQFTDVNPNGVPMEIILDFICPRGLFGFTSNGSTVERNVKLEISFAPVGSTDWKFYNDINHVDFYKSVGGTDVTDFDQFITPNDSATYYSSYAYSNGNSNSNNNNYQLRYFIKPGVRKLLVPEDARWEVGAKVFYGGKRLLGVIQSIVDLGSSMELTLDRVMTNKLDLQVYTRGGYGVYNGGVSYGGANNVTKLRSSRHEAGAAVISGARQAAVFANFRFAPKVATQYQIRVRRINAFGSSGSQKADDVTWGALTTTLKETPINTTKRHVFMELRIKATNQLNGHVQNLSGVASSVLPVYDPDTQTWSRQVTNNPAWIFCDLLTGEVNKKAVPISRLHLPSIVEWAEYCDEVPTPPDGQEYIEPRFACDFVLDYDTTLQGVLAQIGGAAQASLNVVDGKYGVLVDRFKETPVQIFTPRNSRDFASTRVYGPRPHGVKVKFIDPNLGWEVNEVIAYDNGFNEDNATEFDDLTSFGCTNYEQAWRFGRYMIAQNKLRQETISLTVDFENLICTRGDYVQISQDVMRVGGTPARVKAVDGVRITTDDSLAIDPEIEYGYVHRSTADGEIHTSTLTPVASNEFDVDGEVPAVGDLIVIGEVGRIVFDCIVKSISPNDDLSATITLVEKADEIFDYESENELPEYDPQISQTSDPGFRAPKAVTNLTVGDNFWECNVLQSGYNYYVELTWEVPAGAVYEFFEVWVNDGRGYRLFDTTTAKYFKYDVDQSRLDIEHGFKVVAVAANGRKLQLIEMPEVTATPAAKMTPPSDVEALNMMITNQVLQLTWAPIADCDVKEYAIRYSPDNNDVWESSIPLQIVAKNVNSVTVQARTGVYLIKAIDYNGNQSANAARALTTIPNLFDLNIIETMNEAPEFPGVLDQVVELGDALILEEETPGDVDSVVYASEGAYEFADLLDLDDVYSVRLQSLIRADGLKKGELMSDWEHLEDIEHLNSALHSDWDVALQYRATDVFASMASWEHLYLIDHINFGAGVGFTDWRDIPTVGDATGRIFQFRVVLKSLTDNVTPRLFDATVKADMPDRIDSFENQVSHPSEAFAIAYNPVFKGPGSSPNVQITIDDAETGDYWTYDYKTLEGVAIRFYDKNNVQVSRQFDLVAKGYGRRHTSSL